MPTIDLSGAGNGLTNLDYTVAPIATTPSAQYALWATALGVSSTGTSTALGMDNSIFTLGFGTKIWPEQTDTTTYLSSEGGFLFYKTGLAGGANAVFMTIPNINRMVGWSDKPDVMMSFHPVGTDAVTASSSQMRGLNGTSIYLLQYELSGSPGTTVAEIAVRFGLNIFEIVGNTISGTVDYYVTSYNDVDAFSNQTLLLNQTAGNTDAINMSVSSGVPIADTPISGGLIFTGESPTIIAGNSVTPPTLAQTIATNSPLFGIIFELSSGLSVAMVGGTLTSIHGANIFNFLRLSLPMVGGTPNSVNALIAGDMLTFTGNFTEFGATIVTLPSVIGLRYTARLLGALDGQSDLDLPLRNIALRSTVAKKDTATLTIPDGGSYLDGILLRPQGQLQITDTTIFSDNTNIPTILAAMTVDNFSSSQGAKNFSIVFNLSGDVPINPTPKLYALNGVSFIGTDVNGATRVRATPIGTLIVGDLVTLPSGKVIGVTRITKNISAQLVTMELTDG